MTWYQIIALGLFGLAALCVLTVLVLDWSDRRVERARRDFNLHARSGVGDFDRLTPDARADLIDQIDLALWEMDKSE